MISRPANRENPLTHYIGVYLSMKKGVFDNDYYIYDEGRILHHYDRTINKCDIESYIFSDRISDYDKEKKVER